MPLGRPATGNFGCDVLGGAEGVVPPLGGAVVVVPVPVVPVPVIPVPVAPPPPPVVPEPVTPVETLEEGLGVEDGLADPPPELEPQAAANAIAPIGRSILMRMDGLSLGTNSHDRFG